MLADGDALKETGEATIRTPKSSTCGRATALANFLTSYHQQIPI